MRAPIAVFAYNRIDYLKKTIESLSNCRHVNEHICFLFSDGPSMLRKGDTERVIEVREYLESIEGRKIFKGVKLVFSREHLGLRKSIINGLTMVFEENDRVIDIEDDLLLSEDFLDYMDEGLDYFKDNKKISSIAGNVPDFTELDIVKEDCFLGRRFSSWGFGIWRDRWEKVDWSMKDYDLFMNEKTLQDRFAEVGCDLPKQLVCMIEGATDNWAVGYAYMAFKADTYTVYPKYSKALNIGFYGANATGELASQQTRLKTAYNHDFSECKEYEELNAVFKEYISTFNEYKKGRENGFVEKYNRQYHLLHRWMKAKESGVGLEKLFHSKGWDSIAIYGAGELGQHLVAEFDNTNIKIKCVIDKKRREIDGILSLSLDDDIPEVDVLIVTPVFAFREISKDMSNRVRCAIVSLESIFFM